MKGTEMNIYQEHGYKNRSDYLQAIAADFGAPAQTVFTLAAILGPDEDFDGLVTSLEDMEESGELE
jgi:hypothetical protein